MILAGIDYSITCPGICIGEKGSSFEDLMFYSFRILKRHVSNKEQIKLLEYPLYTSEQERHDKISDMVMEILSKHKVDKIRIEDYSFGSKGKVFNIAENTGLLKHKLYKAGYDFDVSAPKEIKKHFSGKGNATKGVMYMSFRDKHCPYEIHHAIGDTEIPDDIKSPVSDMIDAYAIWNMLNALR